MQTTVSITEKLLLNGQEAVAIVGVSDETWRLWQAKEFAPERVRGDGNPRWSREELAAWVRAACPPRAEWAPLWAKARRK